MLFTSNVFLFLFLPLVLLGNYILKDTVRNCFLFIASLLFYAWGEPKVVFVLVAIIIFDYFGGLIVDRYRNCKYIKLIIAIIIGINLSILFIFKYLDFTIFNLNKIFNLDLIQTNILLPIGISFFTFQAISYVIDIYRKNGDVQKNLFNVGLYISFFPQLIAGPIVRYETVAKDIKCRKILSEEFYSGCKRFVLGLSKKVLLANQFAIVADWIINGEYSSISVVWMGAISYTLQIFFDFSSYSDMAVGLGLMFGFHFEENFNYPYISKSISEFWHRWHISLSTWFRDYVYIPLGGSRGKSKSRVVFNLSVVWLSTGIWHGASWNFILWGLYYLSFIVFEKLTGFPTNFKMKSSKILYRLLTIFVIIFGWVLFRITDLSDCFVYIQTMLGLQHLPIFDGQFFMLFKEFGVFLILGIICCFPVAGYMNGLLWKSKSILINKLTIILTSFFYMVITVISISYIIKGSYNPFIYFNF